MRAVLAPLLLVLAACPPAAAVRATPDATESILLVSSEERTVFYVDGHKVGAGKSLPVYVTDEPHTIAAVPPGYRKKEMLVRPPYDAQRPRQFTFLIEDQLEPSADERPAAVASAAQRPADPGRAGAPQPSTFAIVVGVERYAEKLPPPTGARRDAEAIAATLKDALGVPATQLRVDVDERASKAAIERDLEWAKNNVPGTTGSRVVFYFSGHGAPGADGTTYLVPFDGDPRYLDQTGLPLARVEAALAASKAKEVLVFVDACFSGAGGRSVLPPGARPLMQVREPSPASMESLANVAVFSAAGASEISGPTADGTSGLFTSHLLAALRNGQADVDGDGAVSLEELGAWVTPRVARDAQKDNRKQSPTLTSGSALSAKNTLVVWGFAKK